MKMGEGMVETVVTVGADLAEDFVKLKWGDIARGLFGIRVRRMNLLEAELGAPGRVVAFVEAARNAFRG
jgi:hypothetical protein